MLRPPIPWYVVLALLLGGPTLARYQGTSEPPLAAVTTEAEDTIRRALAQTAELEFVETSLGEAIQTIREKYGIPVVVDQNALEADGLDSSIPVTLSVSGVTLRSALRLFLGPLQLTSIVKDEVLNVTTLTEAETAIQVQVYPVADLLGTTVAGDQRAPDFDSLIELITTVVEPDTWDEVGGYGSICPFEASRVLVISQTQEVHEIIADLFAVVRRIRPVDSADRDDSASACSISATNDTPQEISGALREKISLEATDMPLSEFAAMLSTKLGIPVLIDQPALEADGLDATVPVSCDLHDLRVVSALRLALRTVDLTFIVRDEVLMITTLTEEETSLVSRFYPILDLVRVYDKGDVEAYDFDSLIETITTTIEPDTWDEVGGDGSIAPYELKAALVISQTQEVHDRIESLLSRVRAAKADQNVPLPRRPDPSQILTRVYRLQKTHIDSSDLEEILRGVDPENWGLEDDVFVKAIEGKLIVRQRRDVHDRIAKFLQQLGIHSQSMGAGLFRVGD